MTITPEEIAKNLPPNHNLDIPQSNIELINFIRELGDSAHTLAYYVRDEESLKQRNLGFKAHIYAKLLEIKNG